MTLLQAAVNEDKTCVLVVMQGAHWGEHQLSEHQDKSFPENSFNPTCTPFVPEVKPAFAEIAVTWELAYMDACMVELLKRVGSHLQRLLGFEAFDVKTAVKACLDSEDEMLHKAMELEPSDVTLSWEAKDKRFDQFLSHKITDAKDVVLTWYNALYALGYEPFLDRISLDAVENIPMYVEQTVSFVIAVTANLWQSYWCAVELCTAVKHHRDGILNILLVPVQGEKWIEVGGKKAGRSLAFPTPSVMMQNFGKWFPEGNTYCNPETAALISRLYGGGEYTQSRLVPHTLMHYKAFERLLVARLGLSIAAKNKADEIIAAGGKSAIDQYSALAPTIAEANAMHRIAYGEDASQYTIEVVREKGALGGACEAQRLPNAARVISRLLARMISNRLACMGAWPQTHPGVGEAEAEVPAREIDIDKLIDHVLWLREYTASRKYEAATIGLEHLMLVESIVAAEGTVLGRSEAAKGAAEGDLLPALKEAFDE
eukprot:7132339-Prymnesium_polylepis.1